MICWNLFQDFFLLQTLRLISLLFWQQVRALHSVGVVVLQETLRQGRADDVVAGKQNGFAQVGVVLSPSHYLTVEDLNSKYSRSQIL